MNMTVRGLGYTFGLIATVSATQAEVVAMPADLDSSLRTHGAEPDDAYFVCGLLADYSTLTVEEWNEVDEEQEALLARSVTISTTSGA